MLFLLYIIQNRKPFPSNWAFVLTINCGGQTTLMHCTKRSKVASTFSSPVECAHPCLGFLTILWSSQPLTKPPSTGEQAAPTGTQRDWIKLFRRASSVLGCKLDSVEDVCERRMLAKLTSVMDNQTLEALCSYFSGGWHTLRVQRNASTGLSFPLQ